MTTPERSYDTRLTEARETLARARPEQLHRLLQDIRNSAESDETRRSA